MPYKEQIKKQQARFTELGKEIELAKNTNNDDLVQELIMKRVKVYEEITKLNRLQFDAVHHTFDMDDR